MTAFASRQGQLLRRQWGLSVKMWSMWSRMNNCRLRQV